MRGLLFLALSQAVALSSATASKDGWAFNDHLEHHATPCQALYLKLGPPSARTVERHRSGLQRSGKLTKDLCRVINILW